MHNEKAFKSKRRLTIANSIKLNPSNPLPITYNGNSFLTVFGKKYIPILNRRNNLPTLLLEARLTSPTQSACISSIASSVVGNGLSVLDKNNNSIALKNVDPDFVDWMKSVNNDLESFDEVLLNIMDGEREQGNQFIRLIKGNLGKTKFLKIKLEPMQFCRFAELEEGQTEPTSVLISRGFVKGAGTKGAGALNMDDVEEIPLYSPNSLDQNKAWKKDSNNNYHSMLHFKNQVQGVEFYGLPASVSGLRYQVLEGKTAQSNIDNLENNMVMGGMLVLKSAMTEDEAKEQADRILESHVGDGKRGRIAVVSSESGIDDVKFEKYETKSEGSYIELDDRIVQKIIASNNWHKALLGMQEGNSGTRSGNGSGYIRSIWDTKEASLLNPLRRKLTDKVVMQIIKIYADHFGKKDLLNYNFWFKTAMPFSFLGDVKPEQFMKVNEARDLAGLDKDPEKENVYLAEMAAKTNSNNADINPNENENVPNQSASA